MPEESFDVVVLGAGVAAQSVVYRLAEAGRSVAVVEAGPWGGTCATRGCSAKKPYVNAAMAVRSARQMQGRGVTGQLMLDWRALLEFKRTFTEPPKRDSPREMKEAGINTFEGAAKFVDPHTVQVGDQRLQGWQIVIAVGREPRPLEIPGSESTITSDGFLELAELPPRIVFVGGGYIAMEFAGVAAMAGADVTVIESAVYPLGPFDTDAVRTVLASFEAVGVKVLTRREVVAVQRGDDGSLYVSCDDGRPPIACDLVVNATGRRPAITDMGLDQVGIAHGKQGVRVDEFLRSTSHPHLWAAGDVADNGRPPLTPTASEDGRVVAHNLLHGPGQTQIRHPVASVAFTLPPITSAGDTESQAREKYSDIEVLSGDLSTSEVYQQQGERFGYYKLIFCDRQVLRGVHLVGPDCPEVINLFALAIGQQCDKQSLCNATLGYPTLAFNLFSKFREQVQGEV